ncbi:unnamed protein product, partial [Symbiodinium microadriaticum]
ILAAVLQTQTAKDIKSDANFFFNAAVHTAEAASGQGSALSGASSQCLLSYLGYEKTLRLGYRLQRDDASGLQGLRCPFLPGSAGLTSATQVVGGLILFMVAALWTWLSLSRSDEDPKPSHVVFLTSKYQRRYALFETERLIRRARFLELGGRKTLFTFIGALLPIHSSPALQMGCLGIVVLVSLFLYCRYKPYHSPEWNWLANEFHWGHSVPTQQSIIFATAGIAAVASRLVKQRRLSGLKPAGAFHGPWLMAHVVTFARVLLGLWITGCAVRPSREEVRQLLETEVTPRDASPIAEAGAAFLAGESAEYSDCDGLPRNGSIVIDRARIFHTSCTWHGNPGLQVTLKEMLTFQGNLVLTGEIQIMGEQELEGINVSGKMAVIAGNASFVGCRNGMQAAI